MPAPAFALFDTAIGRLAIGWSERGIAAVRLPEPGDDLLRASIRRALPAATEASPPASVAAVIADVVALTRGVPRDFRDVALDLHGVAAFDRDVYAIAREIRAGHTRTYGDLAERLGDPGAARGVGRALARNRVPIIVPCHRVVAASGKTGGFSAPGGVDVKLRLLALEQAFGPLFESARG